MVAFNSSQVQLHERPTEVLIFISLLLTLIILFSICGNALVCAAICTDTHLRQLSNSLYVSLAVADLLVSSVVMTFAMIDWIAQRWVFGVIMCNIFISMDIMCSTASILNILATAIDRYVHIHNVFHYSRIVNRYVVGAVIAFIWMISILMSFVPIHLGWHISGNTSVLNVGMCALQLSPSYAVVSSIISFYLPCVVMVALYVKLYRFARHHIIQIQREQAKTINNQMTVFATSGCVRLVQRKFKTDQKAAITLGVIMGTFLVCWLPFFIINCVKPICNCVPGGF